VTPARRLTVVLLSLAVAALGLWVATRLVWLRVSYQSPLRGLVTAQATGAQIRPELGAFALLAIAAVAAVVATGGWPRRVLGALVVAAGGWAVWQCVSWLLGGGVGPLAELPLQPHPPGDAVLTGAPSRTPASLLGLAAGLLLLAAGAAVVCWARAMPKLGGRYAAPGTSARAKDRDSEWWTAMDAGEDPTVKGPRADPGS
jgi:uncharacterized membrane protein (TIGR02234 family)